MRSLNEIVAMNERAYEKYEFKHGENKVVPVEPETEIVEEDIEPDYEVTARYVTCYGESLPNALKKMAEVISVSGCVIDKGSMDYKLYDDGIWTVGAIIDFRNENFNGEK